MRSCICLLLQSHLVWLNLSLVSMDEPMFVIHHGTREYFTKNLISCSVFLSQVLSTHVLFKIVLPMTTVLAMLTAVTLDVWMGNFVLFQTVITKECFATNFTSERFFLTIVSIHVSCKTSLKMTSEFTMWTFVTLDVGVGFFVLFQWSQPKECFVTNFTRVRFFLNVWVF